MYNSEFSLDDLNTESAVITRFSNLSLTVETTLGVIETKKTTTTVKFTSSIRWATVEFDGSFSLILRYKTETATWKVLLAIKQHKIEIPFKFCACSIAQENDSEFQVLTFSFIPSKSSSNQNCTLEIYEGETLLVESLSTFIIRSRSTSSKHRRKLDQQQQAASMILETGPTKREFKTATFVITESKSKRLKLLEDITVNMSDITLKWDDTERNDRTSYLISKRSPDGLSFLYAAQTDVPKYRDGLLTAGETYEYKIGIDDDEEDFIIVSCTTPSETAILVPSEGPAQGGTSVIFDYPNLPPTLTLMFGSKSIQHTIVEGKVTFQSPSGTSGRPVEVYVQETPEIRAVYTYSGSSTVKLKRLRGDDLSDRLGRVEDRLEKVEKLALDILGKVSTK